MAIERIIMAEGTPAPESAAVASQTGAGEAKSSVPGVSDELLQTLSQRHSIDFIKQKRDEYPTEEAFLKDAEKEAAHIRKALANAQLEDEARKKAAGELLYGEGKELSEQQKQALLRMHDVGKDRPGAGVFNYNQAEISEKARIGAEKTEDGKPVFTSEERDKLFEAGLVGRLPAASFATFAPFVATLTAGTQLRQIGEQSLAMGIRGDANERNLDRQIRRVETLLDGGTITDPTEVALAEQLLANLQGLQNTAERTPEPEIPTPLSDFETVQNSIVRLEPREAAGTITATEQTVLDDARREREVLLLEADRLGLLNSLKEQAYQLYRKTRIDVPPSKRDDMRELLFSELQRAQANPLESRQYWNALQVRGVNQNRLRGIIDYVKASNIDLIRAAFENPRMDPASTSTFQYPNNGVSIIWQGFTPWNESGVRGAPVRGGFDEIRQFVEQERRERPRFVGSYGNYLFYIEFLADGVEELPEAIDDYALRMEKEILAGTIDNIQNNLQERLGWAEKAMQAFMRHFNLERNHPIVMWYSSKMNSVAEIMRAAVMADAGKEGSKNYLQAMDSWGRGFKTEDQTGKKIGDNFFDVMYFEQDTNGWLPVALNEMTKGHGGRWRYGSNKVPFPDNEKRRDYLDGDDRRIAELMATREFKPIDTLLTTHPVFTAFKTELDRIDLTFWPEYVEEARAWERFVTGVDRVDRRNPNARLKFEHPLARKLTRAQFDDMFQPVRPNRGESPAEFDKRIQARREKAKWILKRAERLATALMVDTEATSARLYLKGADGERIYTIGADGEKIYETVPFASLVSQEVMEIVKTDKLKPLGERKFKVFHVLNKLGLVDFPLYGAFDVGADDTGRNDLVKYFEKEPELKAIIDAKTVAPNAKTTIVRWTEDERRIITLVERCIRRAKHIPFKDSRGRDVFVDGTDYENFPGEHTPGGGIKYLKNDVLYPYYGISRDTVRANGMITAAYYGVRTLLGEYGCEDEEGASFLDFVVWQKRRNELELKREGPAFRNPTGVTKWVGRVGGGLGQADLWTNNGADPEHPDTGIVWAPLKGPYRLRMTQNVEMYIDKKGGAIENPVEAMGRLTPDGYTNLLSTVADVYSKIEKALIARRKIENIYSMAAGTAAFENTLTTYDLLDWMDYMPEEYRSKYGYSIEGHLSFSRYLGTTNLFEDGTIFSVEDWHAIMLGKAEPEEVKTIAGKRYVPVKLLGSKEGSMLIPEGEGLMSLLPDYLTEKIYIGDGINPRTSQKFKIDPIPLDENKNVRVHPRVIDLRGERADYKEKYKKAYVQQDGGQVLR